MEEEGVGGAQGGRTTERISGTADNFFFYLMPVFQEL